MPEQFLADYVVSRAVPGRINNKGNCSARAVPGGIYSFQSSSWRIKYIVDQSSSWINCIGYHVVVTRVVPGIKHLIKQVLTVKVIQLERCSSLTYCTFNYEINSYNFVYWIYLFLVTWLNAYCWQPSILLRLMSWNVITIVKDAMNAYILFNQFDLISSTGRHVYVDSQAIPLFVANYYEIE